MGEEAEATAAVLSGVVEVGRLDPEGGSEEAPEDVKGVHLA